MLLLELIAHNLFKIAHVWVVKQSLWNGHKIEDDIPDFYRGKGVPLPKKFPILLCPKVTMKGEYKARIGLCPSPMSLPI